MHSIAPPPPEKVVSFLDGPLNTDFQYVWHFFGKAASLSDKSQAKMLTSFTQLMGLLFIDGGRCVYECNPTHKLSHPLNATALGTQTQNVPYQ